MIENLIYLIKETIYYILILIAIPMIIIAVISKFLQLEKLNNLSRISLCHYEDLIVKALFGEE